MNDKYQKEEIYLIRDSCEKFKVCTFVKKRGKVTGAVGLNKTNSSCSYQPFRPSVLFNAILLYLVANLKLRK